MSRLQRILKVEYEFPPHVKASRECRDLLNRILVPDPSRRVTLQDIQRHQWYRKDLPPGVAEMNDNLPAPSAGVQVLFPSELCCLRLGWLMQALTCVGPSVVRL